MVNTLISWIPVEAMGIAIFQNIHFHRKISMPGWRNPRMDPLYFSQNIIILLLVLFLYRVFFTMPFSVPNNVWNYI